jgi:hypothetical protein
MPNLELSTTDSPINSLQNSHENVKTDGRDVSGRFANSLA